MVLVFFFIDKVTEALALSMLLRMFHKNIIFPEYSDPSWFRINDAVIASIHSIVHVYDSQLVERGNANNKRHMM